MNNLGRCLVFAAALLCITSAAFGWGSATHLYVADHIGAKLPLQNTFELYGSMLPDIYGYSFDETAKFMTDQLHNYGGTMMDAASNKELRSVAYGFLSHNQLHGADATAHLHSLTMPSGEGYMIVKGNELAAELVPTLIDILTTAGLDRGTAEYIAVAGAPELGHDLCETAVDILIKRQDDRLVGAKVLAAASARPCDTPKLLGTVYGPALAARTGMDLAAAKAMIAANESEYRRSLVQYGTLFLLPEKTVIAQLAAMMAPVAENFIETSLPFPLDVTVTPAQVEDFIRKAMVVTARDYKKEVNKTIAWVDAGLTSAGITNTDGWFVFRKEGAEPSAIAAQAVEVPAAFSLNGNYPNPFNPATTVKYAVAETQLVRVSVSDIMGREVAVLVNEVKEPGVYAAVWNGAGAASGVYFCRMTSGTFVQTMRMILQK